MMSLSPAFKSFTQISRVPDRSELNTSFPFAESDGATSLFDTRLFDISDDGNTGKQVYAFDQTLLGYGVETAGASMPGRVYVTAGRVVPYACPKLLGADCGTFMAITRVAWSSIFALKKAVD